MSDQLCELQHFGFTAEQISVERRFLLKQILEDLLQDVLENVKASKDTYPLLVQKKSEIVKTIQEDFEDKLQESETCDRKNFSIPQHVLLPEQFELAKNYTVDDLERLDSAVSHLKQTFLENSIMIAALEMQNSQNKQIEDLVREEQESQLLLRESFEDDLKNFEAISNIIKNSNF